MNKLYITLILFAFACAQHDTKGYTNLLKTSNGDYSKNGWNHYGPGYFTLDKDTGVLETIGGMGLFWYSCLLYTSPSPRDQA